MVDALNTIPGFKCVDSGGAFYAFPDVRGAIAQSAQRKASSRQPPTSRSREYLLEKAGVAVVPGSAFGARRLYPPVVRHLAAPIWKRRLARMATALT